jgi:hypothetical protein
MNELDPESRQLLVLARTARTPNAEDQARVARRLALAVGVSAGTAASAAVSKAAGAATAAGVQAADAARSTTGLFKAAAAWGSVKAGLAGALLLSAAAGVYVSVARPSPAPRSAATVAGPRELPATVDRAASERAVVDAPPIAANEPAKSLVAEANATSDNPQVPTTPRGGDEVKARLRHSVTLGSEIELLHRAQAAWRARSAPRALELLQQHRKRYPRSELRSEREALQVLVLCEVGQSKQAARLASALLKREPESPARAAIEQSCATK